MIARLELDYPTGSPPPALRDFGLPQIYQREWPALHAPELPAIHVAGLRAARQGGRRIAGPELLAVARDTEPRMTPEAALSLIREGEQRAQRESRLPVTIAGELLPPEGDLPVEHVGRLPAKRNGGVPAMREDTAPASRADAAPATRAAAVPPMRKDSVPLVRDDAMPAILLVALVDEPLETPDAPDDAALHDDAPQPEMAESAGSGWRRTAVVAAVATVALLAVHPAYRYLSVPVEAPPNEPVAPATVPTPASFSAASAAASNAAAAIRRAAQVPDVEDRVPEATVAADKPAPATIRLPAPVSVIAPTPRVTAPARAAAAPARAVIAAAPTGVVAAMRPLDDVTPKPDSDVPFKTAGPALAAAMDEPDRVRTAQTTGPNQRPDSAKSASSTTERAAMGTTTSSAVSVAPAVRPATEPPQNLAAAVRTATPVLAKPRMLVASAVDTSSAPMIAHPDVAVQPVAALSSATARQPATATAVPAATPQPMTATPVNAAPPAAEGAASGAAPQAAVLAAAAASPTVTTPPVTPAQPIAQSPQAAAAPSATAMATSPVAASMAAASTEASAAASTEAASTAVRVAASTAAPSTVVPSIAVPSTAVPSMAVPSTAAPSTAAAAASNAASGAALVAASMAAAPDVAGVPSKVAATRAVATRQVVTAPTVGPSSPVEAATKVQAPPVVVAMQEPAATALEPARVRHRPDHPMAAAGTKDTLVFASANVVERPLPALFRRDAHATSQEDPAERVLARQRAGQASQDPVVDRLNVLSLEAALQGKTLSARALSHGLLSSRQTVTSRAPARPPLR